MYFWPLKQLLIFVCAVQNGVLWPWELFSEPLFCFSTHVCACTCVFVHDCVWMSVQLDWFVRMKQRGSLRRNWLCCTHTHSNTHTCTHRRTRPCFTSKNTRRTEWACGFLAALNVLFLSQRVKGHRAYHNLGPCTIVCVLVSVCLNLWLCVRLYVSVCGCACLRKHRLAHGIASLWMLKLCVLAQSGRPLRWRRRSLGLFEGSDMLCLN